VRVVDSEITIDEEVNSAVIDTINTGKPDILFVAFGHVKQEYWIHTYLKQLPSVQVAMGVGGALDFIGGTSKRAPKWVRYIGFEWLYRLMREPKRIGRIWNATAYFLYLHYFKST
jgi:N-acetylglucosaminyldiphosphoundecaprenol N-acetyl-beta-D-mannosaminyltransferase